MTFEPRRPGWVYGKGTIVQYCAVMGELTTEIRAYCIGEVRAYDMSGRSSVSVSFIPPRKRKVSYFTIRADDCRYLTITMNGFPVYDSRWHVPCDMDTWAATNAKFQSDRPFTVRRTMVTEEEVRAMQERTCVRNMGGEVR